MVHTIFSQSEGKQKELKFNIIAYLIISLVGPLQLQNNPGKQQLSHLRKFSIHHCHKCCEDISKTWRCKLGLHAGSAKQPSSPDKVLCEELRYNVLDVGGINLVDQTIDTLPQSIPAEPLVGLARLVLDITHHLGHSVRRNVDSTSAASESSWHCLGNRWGRRWRWQFFFRLFLFSLFASVSVPSITNENLFQI
jgi:hypothetical protein